MTPIAGTITTTHRDPARVACALAPDNLASMRTRAGDGVVVTEIEGANLRSIIASVDDYLMNLAIAEDVCRCASP
ncbi:MAG TPA: KEOPS complex subunit Pcc1 [Methanomicrobiales archaeon]|nr:KEOPS complex subunit Pcc1 [Methanomicrobiales archaeon]